VVTNKQDVQTNGH